MVGGCCGTTPSYTAALKKAVEGVEHRQVPEPPQGYIPMMLSGMTEFILT